jgi:hypothetical protein
VREWNCHEGTYKVVFENGQSEELQGDEIKPLLSEKKTYPLDDPNNFLECEHPDCSRRAWFFFDEGAQEEPEPRFCFVHKLDGMRRGNRQSAEGEGTLPGGLVVQALLFEYDKSCNHSKQADK